MTNSNKLVLFARAPRYGLVKTRLAQDIGKKEALHFYNQCLRQLISTLSNGPWLMEIAAASREEANHPAFNGLKTRVQSEGNIGTRMKAILNSSADSNLIIIGSDIPEIEQAQVKAGFHALKKNDFVFGPATDGGFWLVGCRQGLSPPPEFMLDVRWSSRHALKDTLATLDNDYSFSQVATLDDIDDKASFDAYLQRTDQSLYS